LFKVKNTAVFGTWIPAHSVGGESERNTARETAGMSDELDEGRGSRRTAAGKQSNIGGDKNDTGQGLAEDQARRGAKHGCGCTRDIDLPVAKQGDRAFVVGIASIGVDQGVQGGESRQGLKRQKDAQQQRGSALPFPSKNFREELWHHDGEIYLTVRLMQAFFSKIKKFLRLGSCFVYSAFQPPVAAMAGQQPVAAKTGGFFFGPPVHEKLVVRPKQ
jgi:hypothetical protein